MKRLKILFFACALVPTVVGAQVTFNVDFMKKGTMLSDRQYGIFFEEINHAGDGGLYAELVRNRSFEENATNPDYWWTVGSASQAISTSTPLNGVNTRCIRVVMNSANAGVRNEGYWGMKIVRGQVYSLSFWMRSGSEAYGGSIKAQLQNRNGDNLGSATIDNSSLSTSTEWKKVTAEIKATGSDDDGWLALIGTTAGTVYYDVVSLFPPTYKDRPNGCRKDLAEMLEAIHPKFLRFPGGCVVEGAGTVEVPNRFEWKKSRGPIEERPGHFNRNWNYPVTDGLGMMEYLQLAEDLGAEPLFVCNMGMGHDWEDWNVEPYIQEALDAIEYCNGDESTYWGQLRIKDGHPEPFNLRLLEVGNENYWFGPYSARYKQFVERIGSVYPYIEFVGNAGWVGDWGLPWKVDMVDQHFYESPSWFVNSYRKYDSYDRSSWKVYVGEYAVTKNCGGYGNLNSALGEAVYMCGMERNSDIVKMASYAPIFMNEEQGGGWHPDMIRFNSGMSYGTPSYYVQQMMGSNIGKQNIRWTEENNSTDGACRFALSSWGTSVKFDNIVIQQTVEGKRTTVYDNDFSEESLDEWTNNGGTWRVRDGQLCQTSTSMYGDLFTLNSVALEKNYTIELDATKVNGAEGFLIGFNVQGRQDYVWWNLGGWGNTRYCLEQCIGNYKAVVDDAVNGSLVNNKQYHLKIAVAGTNVKCYIDGELIHDLNIFAPYEQKLYMTASIDEDEGLMYLKVVNPGCEPQPATFNLMNGSWTEGDIVTLSAPFGSDENTTSNPRYIVPKTKQISSQNLQSSTLNIEIPAYSFYIFRLRYDDSRSDIDPNIPSPLISYGFDADGYDDGLTYAYSLKKDAVISQMTDGNKVFCSGSNGYLDLSSAMARTVGGQLTGDYTISIDLLVRDEADLANFCWAYAFNAGTASYFALINSPRNANWYFELKKAGESISAATDASVAIGEWNNIVYSQANGVGTLFLNGYAMATINPELVPADFSQRAYAYLAKSPFTADDLMSNVCFDNFMIFDSALTPGNIAYLSQRAGSMSTEVEIVDRIEAIEADNGSAPVYNLQGMRVNPSTRGIVIKNGKKVFIK